MKAVLSRPHHETARFLLVKRTKGNRPTTALPKRYAEVLQNPHDWRFIRICDIIRLTITHPHQTNNFLKRFCEDNHLENFTPHVLRHLHGSYLLQSGIDLAAVSQKLGHTKKSFTADVYIHAIQSVEQQTAVVMEGILTNLTDKNAKGQA